MVVVVVCVRVYVCSVCGGVGGPCVWQRAHSGGVHTLVARALFVHTRTGPGR